MKIGIITIHNSPNYGACLQSYALYKYIANQGVKCELIDLKRPIHAGYVHSEHFKPFYERKKTLMKKVKDLVRPIVKPNSVSKETSNPVRISKFQHFNSAIKFSQPYYNIEELYANPPKYDVYISGSDQLWNPEQPFSIEPYFLTFVKDKEAKKISYASSIGLKSVEEHILEKFTSWLKSYDDIAVREQAAIDLLQPKLSKAITKVSDPTFLLAPSEWKSLAIPSQYQNYIFCFILGGHATLLENAIEFAKKEQKQLIIVAQRGIKENPDYIAIDDAGPEEFLGLINGADCVLTDSFHGTVFSLLLGVPNFYTYVAPTNKRASRLESLLEPFGYLNHIIRNDDFTILNNNQSIDIDKRNMIIGQLREQSRNYLNKYLKND